MTGHGYDVEGTGTDVAQAMNNVIDSLKSFNSIGDPRLPGPQFVHVKMARIFP